MMARSAKQDHSLAQFKLGRAYYLGIGLEQDHKKTKYWFSRAADNEEPKSIDILAKLGWADGDIDNSMLAGG
jgi:TPR repeat protein